MKVLNGKNMVLAALLLLSAAMLRAGTAEDVIEEYYKSRGGRSALEAISSWKIKANTVIGAQSIDAPVTFYMKRPKKIRVETEMNGKKNIQACNEKSGWFLMPMMNMTKPAAMDEASLKQMQTQSMLIDGPFYNYKELGVTASYGGKTKEGKKEYHKIQLKAKSDVEMEVWISTADNLAYKIKMTLTAKGQKMTIVNNISGYKEVSGVKVPHKFETIMNGQKFSTLTFKSVKANEKIADSMFTMPK